MDPSAYHQDKEADDSSNSVKQVGAGMGLEDAIRAKLSRIRHWRLTSLGRKRPRHGLEFTLLTYNLLAQAALDAHPHLYARCSPPHVLAEEYRLSRLLPELLRSRSDLLCLQEVEQRLFEGSLAPALGASGFGALFKRRTGGKSDGCAIFWRRSKFSLLRHREVELKAAGAPLLDRDNVGLIAVLRPRSANAESSCQLHLATTHLLFNPRRGDIKLCQLRLLLAELERSAFRGGDGEGRRSYHPTVLCGDFNMEPGSPLYRFVEEGRLDVAGLRVAGLSGQRDAGHRGGAQLTADRVSLGGLGIGEAGRFGTGTPDANGSLLDAYQREQEEEEEEESPKPAVFRHDFSFVPAYRFRPRDGGGGGVTSMTGRDCSAVDHIFYHVREKLPRGFREGPLRLLGTLSLPSADELRDLGGLPNAHLGSDHLCLVARFLVESGDR